MNNNENKHHYCSKAQKDELVELVKADDNLLKGKFSSSFTFKDAERKWIAIATRLNAIPGGEKNWKQWRKTWQDLRSRTKSKQASISKHARGTGGGPPIPDNLTSTEQKIIDVISPTAILGDSNINETRIQFFFDDMPQASEDTEKVDNITQNDQQQDEPQQPVPTTPFSEKSEWTRNTPYRTAGNKLLESTKASTLLAETSKERFQFMKTYYEKKLVLMERQTNALEEIAITLSNK